MKQKKTNKNELIELILKEVEELYKSKDLGIEFFASYKNLVKDFENFKANIQFEHKRWEPMEDCSKYTFSVFKKN